MKNAFKHFIHTYSHVMSYSYLSYGSYINASGVDNQVGVEKIKLHTDASS